MTFSMRSCGSVKKVSKAEIIEQLGQSEKLYKDLNQTWEEKLQKTEEIQKERESALEELGITIEKGSVGVSTPKKTPHLVNLSDDPLLAECLVYNIKPGTTTVGSIDDGSTAEIRLNGSKILHEHCTFENIDGVVTIVPNEGAAVMVNGVRIDKPKRLRSGYRVILGDFHIFRFNHPLEARAERAEQGSYLRYSINASDLPSPSRPRHERTASTMSRPDSDNGFDSPRAFSPQQKASDSDWTFARREAVSSQLGSDQQIKAMTDDELDVLFEDLQRIRAGRRNKHESRIFDAEDDTDSNTSYPVREKYASNGTIDNFSLDTVITMPSTPHAGEHDDQRLRLVREDMQEKLDQQKEEYQEKLKRAEEAHVEMEVIRVEKAKMEESLVGIKQEMQRELQKQKEAFERQIRDLRAPAKSHAAGTLTPRQVSLVKWVIERWRQRRHVSMAEKVLQNASLLKEAQVLAYEMDKEVSFQFCVVDIGHTFASSYDLVLNGVSLDDDENLENSPKPCIGVRVIDYKKQVVHLWSIHKLLLLNLYFERSL